MNEIDIVELYNRITGRFYILHKKITVNPVAKAYKTYTWSLWEIEDNNRQIVAEISNTYKIINNISDKAEKDMASLLLIKLFEMYESSKTGKL